MYSVYWVYPHTLSCCPSPSLLIKPFVLQIAFCTVVPYVHPAMIFCNYIKSMNYLIMKKTYFAKALLNKIFKATVVWGFFAVSCFVTCKEVWPSEKREVQLEWWFGDSSCKWVAMCLIKTNPRMRPMCLSGGYSANVKRLILAKISKIQVCFKRVAMEEKFFLSTLYVKYKVSKPVKRKKKHKNQKPRGRITHVITQVRVLRSILFPKCSLSKCV